MSADVAPGWSFDRRIPPFAVLAFILALLAQAASAVVWGARAEARLASVEEKQRALEDVPVAIARLEAQGEATGKALDRIEQRLGTSR